jgi:hypothetical protein
VPQFGIVVVLLGRGSCGVLLAAFIVAVAAGVTVTGAGGVVVTAVN